MTHTTPDQDVRLMRLAALAAEEAEAVLALLPALLDVQFDRSLAGRGSNDTGRRAVGGHSDPTADIATDPGRLYLRSVLGRSLPHLGEAVKHLRGVRRGMERALVAWEGDPDTEPTPSS